MTYMPINIIFIVGAERSLDQDIGSASGFTGSAAVLVGFMSLLQKA